MQTAEKIFGAITVSVLGSLIFLAPDSMLPDRLTGGNILVQPAYAQSSYQTNPHVAKINAADDAYFKAAIALETAGKSAERLASLEKADDSYFEAVIAYEAVSERATQLAKIEAADDAYFKAVIALEATGKQTQQLAELKVPENKPATMMLAQRSDDELVTGSIAGNVSPVARELAKVKTADDDYFDAVIAIETSGENPEDLAKLKAADDAYFNAVIALETANADAAAAAAKKGAKTVKMAAAGGMPKPAAPMTKKTPLPAKVYKTNRRVVKKAHRAPVHMARVEEKSRRDPISAIFNVVVKGVILSPMHMLSKKSQ